MTMPMSDRTVRDLARTKSDLHRLQRQLAETEEENRRLQVVVGAQLVRLTGAYPNLGPFLVHLAVLDDAAHPLTGRQDQTGVRQRTTVGSSVTPGGKVAHWSRLRAAYNRRLANLTAELEADLDGTRIDLGPKPRCGHRDCSRYGRRQRHGAKRCDECGQPLQTQTTEVTA